MGDALIDLGDMSPGRVANRPDDDRPASSRAPGIVLVLVFVAMLTGAVHRAPPVPPAIIEARLGESMYVADDAVFVVSGGPGLISAAVQNKIVTAYHLPSGELRSRTTVAVSGRVFDVQAAGATLLVSYQVDTLGAEATVALTEGTELALWRRPARLLAVDAEDGLALLRESSPQYGNLHWYGVDLKSGDMRWSVEQPRRGFTTEVAFTGGFPEFLVTATDTGDLEVRSTTTGAVRARTEVPVRPRRVGADVPVWLTDDLVLVGETAGTSAYELPTLARRWHSSADLAGRWVQNSCAVVICALSWRGGMLALDPATGAERWSGGRWNFADQAGPFLVAGINAPRESTQTVSVLDPGTGRVRGTFGTWQTIGPAGADGTVVGLRADQRDDSVWYAELDPATLGVRLLGRADRIAGDCRTTPEVLVCRRLDASVAIWTLK